jgi:hypothetical protein
MTTRTETGAPSERSAPAADAVRLAPGTAPNKALLRALREHAGRPAADRVRAALDEAAGILGAAETRVVFGGHFSSGKSSVINTLIGRPLLPSSRFPETGVPCLLRSGTADKIVVVPVNPREGARETPVTTEKIAEVVKLIGSDGAHRDSVLAIERLDVTLACQTVPDGTVWVDSPGSNDTGVMNDRATAAADGADVLVWVVNSQQPVSEIEQDLLAAHIATHGPASVVFLVNAFLTEDSTDGWDEFLTEDMPVMDARIAGFIDTGTVSKSVVVMSARAAAKSRDDYGGLQARTLVTSLSDGVGEGWRRLATRRFRAMIRLGEVDEWLAGLISAERERLTAKRADRDAAVSRTARFTAAAEQRVRQVLARRRPDASEAVAEATRAASTASDATAAAATLEAALLGVWERIAADVAAAVAEEARRHEQHAPAVATLTARIKATVAGGNLAISAGSGSGSGKGAGGALAGAGAGFVLGSVVPGIGHVVGPAIGAVVGYSRGRKAQQQQRIAAAAAIERTGGAAVDVLTGPDAVRMITGVMTEVCADAAPPQPGEEKLTALRNAQMALTRYADELRGAKP